MTANMVWVYSYMSVWFSRINSVKRILVQTEKHWKRLWEMENLLLDFNGISNMVNIKITCFTQFLCCCFNWIDLSFRHRRISVQFCNAYVRAQYTQWRSLSICWYSTGFFLWCINVFNKKLGRTHLPCRIQRIRCLCVCVILLLPCILHIDSTCNTLPHWI